MIATRMFCELRTVRKLTAPPVVSGTATTKNRTRSARNSQAQMLLRNRMSRCTRVRAPEETVDAWARAIREARSVTDPSSGRLHRPRTLAGARNFAPLYVCEEGWSKGRGGGVQEKPQAALLAWHGINEAGDRRVFYVAFVDDGEAGLDAVRQTGHAGGVGLSEHHGEIPHIERLLRQNQRYDALVHQLNRELRRVVGDNLDVAAEACVDDRRPRALGAEHVGAEHAGQIGIAREHSGRLLRGLVGIIQIVVGAEHLNVGIVFRHRLLEPLLAALDGTDVGIGRVDVDGPLAADRFGQSARGDATALGIVGADVTDGELDWALVVVAVAEERVDGDDLDARVISGLQWADHLILVGRRNDDVLEVAARDH